MSNSTPDKPAPPAKKQAHAAKPVAARKPAKPAPPADKTASLSLGALVVCIIMAGALCAFVFGNQRADIMLAVSRESRGITALQSSDTPNIGTEALLNWAKLAVSETFTYNFNDMSPRIIAAQRFFTKEGWDGFLAAMYQQKVLDQVQTQRQFVSTVPGTNTVVTSEGEVGGVYFWTLQMNIVTSVYTGATSIKYGNMSLKIARRPTRESDSGYPFGIVQITQ